MAGYKVKGWFGRLKLTIRNWFLHKKLIREGKAENKKAGRRRFLTEGIWIDNENYLYNCMGQCIGKWEEDQKEES